MTQMWSRNRVHILSEFLMTHHRCVILAEREVVKMFRLATSFCHSQLIIGRGTPVAAFISSTRLHNMSTVNGCVDARKDI